MSDTKWMDNLLNGGKISKEAMDAQGTDKQDHFERKVIAHPWVNEVLDLDPVKVEAEFLAAQAAEAKLLGKTAAQEANTPEEVIESDYARQIKAYSDSNLMELLALARAHKDNVTQEKFAEYKEKAKKNVESGRAKCEEELLKLTGDHTLLDWAAAFKKFSKDAEVEQPKEKDLYKPEVPTKEYDMDHPKEEKFKLPTKEEMVPAGNGREADERTEVTKQAVPVIKEASLKVAEKVKDSPANDKENIAMPEGKKSAGDKPEEAVEESTLLPSPKEVGDKDDQAAEANSPEKGDKAKHDEAVNKEAHCGMDHSAEPISPLKREELPVEVKAEPTEGCPVCGGMGEDLGSLGQRDHMRCRDCGIMYSHGKEAKCAKCGQQEIENKATKEDVIKKVAEIESPWKIIKDESGQDVIARVTPELKKESEEDKKEEIQK